MRKQVPSVAQVRGWKITAPATMPQVPTDTTVAEPMHGYTLAAIDDAARSVLRIDRWYAGDTDERYAAIWHAITEHLLVADEPPTRRELLNIGQHAANRYVHSEMHHHGRDATNTGQAMPGFERYWATSPSPSPEPLIVDRLALRQVLPLLTERQTQALMALAAYEDYSVAAAVIGSTYNTYCTLIRQARERIFKAWHQGETAPKNAWRTDVRHVRRLDSAGKARLTISEVETLRARYMAGEKLRAVAADAGVPVSTLSALLRGTRTPAPDPVGT